MVSWLNHRTANTFYQQKKIPSKHFCTSVQKQMLTDRKLAFYIVKLFPHGLSYHPCSPHTSLLSEVTAICWGWPQTLLFARLKSRQYFSRVRKWTFVGLSMEGSVKSAMDLKRETESWLSGVHLERLSLKTNRSVGHGDSRWSHVTVDECVINWSESVSSQSTNPVAKGFQASGPTVTDRPPAPQTPPIRLTVRKENREGRRGPAFSTQLEPWRL